uniref:Mothers against decapentaplegic homolog n=1 Tax=Elaeophora elaphi TaxID=1147741 RepID=A0A158Q7K1_9BILA
MNAGGLIHQQPSTIPMVSATTTATNTGCVPVQFFNGFLDGNDNGLIHQQQQQQVPLQQILRTQMPGNISNFPAIMQQQDHQQQQQQQQMFIRQQQVHPQHGVPTIQHYSDSVAVASGMRQILPNAVPFSPNFYEYQPVQAMHNMHPPMIDKTLIRDVSQQHNDYPGNPMPSSSHHATASATDPCAQIAHVLQCYQQGGEDAEFVRKAIESLVKKLKDKRNELENLITAVTSAGKQPTSCVTIQRSLDGRLQVAGRKGVPHVVYARIWRWPNVSKNELQKLPICAIAPDNQDVICINPYHYERIVSSSIGNIDMSTLRLDALTAPSSSSQVSVVNSLSSNVVPGQMAQAQIAAQSLPIESSYCDVASPGSLNMLQGGTNDSAGADERNAWLNQNCVLPAANSSAAHLYQQNSQANYQQINDSCNYSTGRCRYNLDSVRLPSTPMPDHWCSISYYELDTQIGETFRVRKDRTEVVVDGGVNPAGAKHGRFCLGALSNVHRSEASEKARKAFISFFLSLHIGKGVRISTQRDGSVYLECLSHKSVFVRSYYLDFENDIEYGTTVHKFCSGSPSKKIFDLRWAFAEMEHQSKSARLAVVAQAAAVAGYLPPANIASSLIEHVGTGVDDLRRICCIIAISFVKGWGVGYNRTSIKETPCWVELQLHRPLQLLDQLLKKNEY